MKASIVFVLVCIQAQKIFGTTKLCRDEMLESDCPSGSEFIEDNTCLLSGCTTDTCCDSSFSSYSFLYSYDLSTDYTPMSVQEAWDHQFVSFGHQDLEGILMNYNEESIITTFDVAEDELSTYQGVDEITPFMENFFESLTNLTDLNAPFLEVSEESKMVFLVWRNPASGYLDATDTVLFDMDYKIDRQNIVFRSG